VTWRPERPPTAARRVINASRQLDATPKLLWTDIHHLDGSPEGCYARPDVLAQRLGVVLEDDAALRAWERGDGDDAA
jgi:hypothetical protein